MKRSETKNKILVGFCISLIVGSLLCSHFDDWTGFVLFVPIIWGPAGLFFDYIINGVHHSRELKYLSVACAFIIANVVTIFVHRDTVFIIGRLLGIISAIIMIIATAKDCVDFESEKITKKQ